MDNQAESNKISTSLELEQIDVNLFRSVKLYLPPGGRQRGVFGGQVISQALVAATRCVKPVFGLHSFHCYFLLSASPAVPIVYFVERLREGRSYTTRSVKAVQNGKIIFQAMCSFHIPEPSQRSHQWSIPAGVRSLEDCELDEDLFRRRAAQEGVDKEIKELFLDYAAGRAKGPIAIRRAANAVTDEKGVLTTMFWVQARTGQTDAYEAPYQKVRGFQFGASYCLTVNFCTAHGSALTLGDSITVAADTLGLIKFSKGRDTLGMNSTVDHSIWFYDDSFDCEDGLLYVVTCPRARHGRAVVQGRLYSRSGTLVAVTCQEGVVRASRM